MEIDYIKSHMVIERYVQGKLDNDEEAAFEERLVWDQALQEEVELAETMRSWLLDSAKETRYAVSKKNNGYRWFPNFLLNPGYAAAASLAIGALGTYSVLQGTADLVESPPSEAQRLVIVPPSLYNETDYTFNDSQNSLMMTAISGADVVYAVDESTPSVIVPLLVTRGQESELQPIPVTLGAITTILVDAPDFNQTYNVQVRRSAGGEPVWTQEGLPVGYLDMVAVGIPGGALPPANYILAIESTAADFSQEIPFKTVVSE